MRRFLVFIVGLMSFSGFAQEWQTLHCNTYLPTQPNPLFSFFQGQQKLAFKINPYDTSIWMARGSYIMQFDSDGEFHYYDDSDNPDFDNFADFTNVEFTTNSVFACNEFYGLYEFDGTNWLHTSPVSDGIFLHSDVDTLWMGRMTGDDLIVNESGATFNTVNNRRLASKNGEFWGWNSAGYLRRYLTVSNYEILDADTISFLLGNDNYDFKFSPNNNHFYTCGDYGISIALDQNFIDTITPNNTTGMPQFPVMEIEFDSQDNIWAAFGDWSIVAGTHPIVSFGYLDRSTMEWTVYDTTNSAVTAKSSIEVDPCDNLWLSNMYSLHVLKVGNCEAQWLSAKEENLIDFSIYPNPSDGIINLDVPEKVEVDEIRILDLSGRIVESFPYTKSVHLNLPEGSYLLQLLKQDDVIGTQKVLLR